MVTVYNGDHNILDMYTILDFFFFLDFRHVRFAASKTELDILYKNLYIDVAKELEA